MSEQHEIEEVVSLRGPMPPMLKNRMIRMQGGKMYLQVADRMLWFRKDAPAWGVLTQLLEGGYDAGFATVQATITDETGRMIAQGTKTESRQDFPAGWVEKAETGAIGRALAVAGWGTQFALADFDEDKRIVDSPQQAARRPNGNGTQVRRPSDPAPYREERIDGAAIHPKTVDPATQRETTILRNEENEHFAPRTTDEEAAQSAALRKGIADHKGWMVNRKLEPENKALSLWLLNCAMYDVGEGKHTFWTSRKELTAEQWTACNAYLSKLPMPKLNSLVQEFYAKIEAEEAGATDGDPFADGELLTVPADQPTPTHHGH